MFKGHSTEEDEQLAAQQQPPPATAAAALQPIVDPSNTPTQSDFSYSSQSTMGQEPEIVEAHEDERPTDSHHLADMATKETPIEEKGHAQMDHNAVEVKNLGWNTHAKEVAQPMVGGLSNEDLWILVRRFDKVGPRYTL